MPQPHDKFLPRLVRQARKDPAAFAVSSATTVLLTSTAVAAIALTIVVISKHCGN